MSRHRISNPAVLTELMRATAATSACDRHRALVILTSPPDGALSDFAATHEHPYIGPMHKADRADRITEILGSEFDSLIHETHDGVDAGLLAALAGTLKAGGVLVLGLPFARPDYDSTLSISPFNQRFLRLLEEMVHQFPGKVVWPQSPLKTASLADTATFRQSGADEHTLTSEKRLPAYRPTRQQKAAQQEQHTLLQTACAYLTNNPRGCITITGRRGRGKSALLGQLARWLNTRNTTFAVTAARRSALASLHRHSSIACRFIAPADARLSGCQVLLVDEASSLPLSVLESFLATHEHVIYCSTIEGYENTGRAFALRFGHLLLQHHAHTLALRPRVAWRWDDGDPLEHLIDTLLMGGSSHNDDCLVATPGDVADTGLHAAHSPGIGALPVVWHGRLVDRAALALDESLLRQVYGLLRDTHYQTSATDLSHLLNTPDLQLWVMQEGALVKAALLLVLEGGIDPSLHEAIVSKQRRLPHQLLPQLLAQSANLAQALAPVFARVIRISVADTDRRRGLGSQLLQVVERAIVHPGGSASAIGASFASDTISIAFWQRNGYTRFHTGFKPNPRTGKPAITVIKSYQTKLDPVVKIAVSIHDDNHAWLNESPEKSDSRSMDTDLLRRFAHGQRSVQDTYAALSRLAQRYPLPLQQQLHTTRRRYEAALRLAVKTILE